MQTTQRYAEASVGIVPPVSGVGDVVSTAVNMSNVLGRGRKRWSRAAAQVCNAIKFSAADRPRAVEMAARALVR